MNYNMNNINPRVWGPTIWKSILFVVNAYPNIPSESDRDNMRNYLHYMGTVLPCESCRINFSKHIQEYPIENALNSRSALELWVSNIYNQVRKNNNLQTMTFNEIYNKYMHTVDKGTNNNVWISVSCVLLLIIVLIILIFIFKKPLI